MARCSVIVAALSISALGGGTVGRDCIENARRTSAAIAAASSGAALRFISGPDHDVGVVIHPVRVVALDEVDVDLLQAVDTVDVPLVDDRAEHAGARREKGGPPAEGGI